MHADEVELSRHGARNGDTQTPPTRKKEIKYFIYQYNFNRHFFDSNIKEHHQVLSYKDETEISFYAYYADYDWVVFCWVFGKMIDLPEGFPMYCRDLKQMIDEKYMFQINKYD